MEKARDCVIRAAMKGVRLYGLDGVTMRQIAELAGVSAGNTYIYFSSKDELMYACFERVDRQIAHIFDSLELRAADLQTDPEGAIRQLWTPYFRWLVAHPDETVFYHRFRDNPGFPEFDKTRDISYFASFSESVHAFESLFHIFEKVNFNILWLHMLTSTVMFAKYVVEGVLPNGAETEESIFQLQFYGVRGLLGRGQ